MKMELKKDIFRYYLYHVLFLIASVFISGPINTLFLKLELPQNRLMTFSGLIIFVFVAVSFMIADRIYFFPLIRRISQWDSLPPDEKKQLLHRVERAPLFMYTMLCVTNIIVPLLIGAIIFGNSRKFGTEEFIIGLLVVLFNSFIQANFLFITAHHHSYQVALRYFVPPEFHYDYTRKRFGHNQIFLLSLHSVISPILIVLLIFRISAYHSGNNILPPFELYAFLSLLFGALFILFLFFYGNYIFQLMDKYPIPADNDKTAKIDLYDLSKREIEILELLLQGYSNQEIGEQLYISLPTVKNHLSHIYRKMGVKNRTEMVKRALSNGNGINSK